MLGGREWCFRPGFPTAAGPEPIPARAGERSVYFDEAEGFVTTPIYRRERLLAGHRIAGPAVIEQMDSTTVILPGQDALVDAHGNLLIRTVDGTDARR